MGFDYFIDLHVEVDGDLSVFEGHEISHRVKETILEAIPGVMDVLIHIEPKRKTVDSQQSTVISKE